MAKTQFEIRGISRLKSFFRPGNARKAVDAHVTKATGQNALLVVRAIRKKIQAGDFEGNASLTVAIKGSTKPLVHSGNTFQAITHTLKGPNAFVGILRTAKEHDIAVMLHEGTELPVTERMRGLFYVLWLASVGSIPASELNGRAAELFSRYQKWKPLKPSTTKIVIPGRPFIREAFEDRALRAKIAKNWANAVQAGMLAATKK